MKVWIVEALRYGDREKHSYIVGVYNSKEMAKYCGEIEEAWRGGNKYFYEVSCMEIEDRPEKEKLDWYKATDPKLHEI